MRLFPESGRSWNEVRLWGTSGVFRICDRSYFEGAVLRRGSLVVGISQCILFRYAQCRGSVHDELAGRLVYGGESAGCGSVGYVSL